MLQGRLFSIFLYPSNEKEKKNVYDGKTLKWEEKVNKRCILEFIYTLLLASGSKQN